MAKRDGHGISRQISGGMDTTDVTDNPHIEIQDAFTFQQFNENGEFILNQSSSPTQGYNSDGSQDSCHMEDASEMGLMSVKVKMGLNRVESVSGDKIPSYKMTSNPRGQALIIDIEKYDNEIQDERIGSKFDRDNLKQLLTGLHFNVKVCLNLKYTELHQELIDFSKDPSHAKADMMILVILSHGRDGKIITSSGREYQIESIYEKFNNRECPFLKGKPKFFIIQACRGDEKDRVLIESNGRENLPYRRNRGDSNNSRLNSPVTKRGRRGSLGTDAHAVPDPWNVGHGDIDKARPTWEDMIIAYSTIPGYTSMRDHEKGTWFIQSLVEVFMNHAGEHELIDLLRMTSERLSGFKSEDGEKQTCNIEMRHLYKKIYFQPGIFHDAQNGKELRNSKLNTL